MSQENDFKIKVGDEFKTKLALKTALMLHSAAEGLEVTVEKSDKSVYTVVCSRKSEGCTWRLYVRGFHHGWVIRTINEDIYVFHRIQPKKNTFGANEIKELFTKKLLDTPGYSAAEMKKDLTRDYSVESYYHVCRKAREMILKDINGESKENFARLKQYLDLFQGKNPGSYTCVHEENGVFIWAFCASANSTKAVQADTHMRSKFKGILLCAVGIDALGSIVPLCYAWAAVENDSNWLWFMELFRNSYQNALPVEEELTFLSDRQKGLVEAVNTVLPNSHHGFC
jgi:hypothetical protein